MATDFQILKGGLKERYPENSSIIGEIMDSTLKDIQLTNREIEDRYQLQKEILDEQEAHFSILGRKYKVLKLRKS